jgi:hypothetical protein
VRVPVVVWAEADIVALVTSLVTGTAAEIVSVTGLTGALAVRDPAAIVVGDFDRSTLHLLSRRVPEDARHRILVITQSTWDVETDVAWTVIRKSELRHTLPRLIEDAEAVPVELLASVKGEGQPVSRFGCVASIASRFVLIALDDPPERPVVSFVLPGHGRIELAGAMQPAFGRTGLWRVTPEDETVRAALRAFTLKRQSEDEA